VKLGLLTFIPVDQPVPGLKVPHSINSFAVKAPGDGI
jgi:hypothetical protein